MKVMKVCERQPRLHLLQEKHAYNVHDFLPSLKRNPLFKNGRLTHLPSRHATRQRSWSEAAERKLATIYLDIEGTPDMTLFEEEAALRVKRLV